MELKRALRLGERPCIAFVGAGGKTTALFTIAREIPPPVIITSSTHLSVDETRLADAHYVFDKGERGNFFTNYLTENVVLVTGPVDGNRTSGLSLKDLSRLNRFCKKNQLPLLIEADGSRGRPVKAPAPHEPPIPQYVDTVVVVAGLPALGKPVDAKWVHRPHIFSEKSKLPIGENIDRESIVKVLVDPMGGMKNIPSGARKIALLNQADTFILQNSANKMARLLLPSYDSVVIASLNRPNLTHTKVAVSTEIRTSVPDGAVHSVQETIAGVVLAGGGATRYGEPKLLLDWRGQPLVRQVVSTALQSGLQPIVVVTGAYEEQVRKALSDLAVKIVHNGEWQTGQGTSVSAGSKALPKSNGGAVFLLADQPQIPVRLVQSLVKHHSKTLAPIVAPKVGDRIANPVLFDRDLFSELISLSGKVGGRSLFSNHKISTIAWDDDSILLDVDTPNDYDRLLKLELNSSN
jgi:molybdenum cofactor cytidylyltransferase